MKPALNKQRRNHTIFFTAIFFLITAFSMSTCTAQQHEVKPDLSNIKNFRTLNRTITLTTNSTSKKPVIHLDAKENAGIAWINGVLFEKGIIEFDVKGENIPQQSFVGLAFHAANDSTYDAVYLRPFNFAATDTVKRHHAIQYISLPKYDWPFLRDTYPGRYENELVKPADPDQWLHVKLLIAEDKVAVYVNNNAEPSLVVKPLSTLTTGKIGFWVGNGSKGDFADLKLLATK